VEAGRRYYDVQGAVCAPKPLQQKLPIWIGGRGPQRTARLAAQYGDGHNLAYVSPAEFKTYQEGLVRACEKLKRDPATLQHSVNLHFHMGADEAGARVAREKLQKFRRDNVWGRWPARPLK